MKSLWMDDVGEAGEVMASGRARTSTSRVSVQFRASIPVQDVCSSIEGWVSLNRMHKTAVFTVSTTSYLQ